MDHGSGDTARDIELRHLRYFLTVVEEGHFGRAARRLHMTQPPLSQQIMQLEKRLGVRLLERRPRVTPTAAGRALAEAAPGLLRDVATAFEDARRIARGETGRLRIGFGSSTLLTGLPRPIQRFRDRFPDVDLSLREMSTARQAEALRDNAIDVGFARHPVDTRDIEARTVWREPLLVAAPDNHAVARAVSTSLADLAEEPFVHFPRAAAPGLHDRIQSLWRAAGASPRIVMEADEWLTIVALVHAGLGLAVVPAGFRRLRWEGVTYVSLDDQDAVTEVAMIWRARDAPPGVERLAETIRESVADEGEPL